MIFISFSGGINKSNGIRVQNPVFFGPEKGFVVCLNPFQQYENSA